MSIEIMGYVINAVFGGILTGHSLKVKAHGETVAFHFAAGGREMVRYGADPVANKLLDTALVALRHAEQKIDYDGNLLALIQQVMSK